MNFIDVPPPYSLVEETEEGEENTYTTNSVRVYLSNWLANRREELTFYPVLTPLAFLLLLLAVIPNFFFYVFYYVDHDSTGIVHTCITFLILSSQWYVTIVLTVWLVFFNSDKFPAGFYIYTYLFLLICSWVDAFGTALIYSNK